jgi:nitrous oxide reductase
MCTALAVAISSIAILATCCGVGAAVGALVGLGVSAIKHAMTQHAKNSTLEYSRNSQHAQDSLAIYRQIAASASEQPPDVDASMWTSRGDAPVEDLIKLEKVVNDHIDFKTSSAPPSSEPLAEEPADVPSPSRTNGSDAAQKWLAVVEAARGSSASNPRLANTARGILVQALQGVDTTGATQINDTVLADLEKALGIQHNSADAGTMHDIGGIDLSERQYNIMQASIRHGGEEVAQVARDVLGAIQAAGEGDRANTYVKRVLVALKGSLAPE